MGSKSATLLLIGFLHIFIVTSSCSHLYSSLGGNFSGDPGELNSNLTSMAKRLINQAYADIDPSRLIDFHTHILGMGNSPSGIWINPAMQSLGNPLRYFRFQIFKNAAGIENIESADQNYLKRLLKLIDNLPYQGKFMILGLDKHYRPDGKEDPEWTDLYIPNEYIANIAKQHPKKFIPMISVNPHRRDAIDKLEYWRKQGIRFIKWLPNAMGIDPSDPKLESYYLKMKELGMILLVHVGDEGSVHTGPFEKFGNPLLLRRPLDMGVKVIMAHCASDGTNKDLDASSQNEISNFDLFVRMMNEPRYEGLLFGEISGLTQINRFDGPLQTLLKKQEWHHRLVNGSDYPLPALNTVVWTGSLERAGFITGDEMEALDLIYKYNPILFDFVLKRTVRHPETGERFPSSVFMFPKVLK